MRALQAIDDLRGMALQRVNDPRNVAKGEWPPRKRRLFVLLLGELWELFLALVALARAEREYRRVLAREPDILDFSRDPHHGIRHRIKEARSHVYHEAGDCCAYLAFIVDRA